MSQTTAHLEEVTVNVETPGTLGDLILQQTENLTDVVTLHLSGTINDADAITLQQRLTRLRNLDALGLQMTEIPRYFFHNLDTLRTVVLPAVTKIVHEQAFDYCDNLKSVNLPEGLTDIEGWAFYNCENLQDISFPSTLKVIGDNAFYGNKSLPKALLPEGLESLGEEAFASCESLQEVNIPASIKIIPQDAFYRAQKLESLTIPEGITEIGKRAFQYAFSYRDEASGQHEIHLTMPSTLKRIGADAFSYSYNIVELTLNEGLEYLGEYCFMGTAIQEVTIPSTVYFAKAAFGYCDKLTRITCMPLVPPANHGYNLVNVSDAQAVVKGCTLAVPAVSITEYKQTLGYDHFDTYMAMDYTPTNITINRDFHLTVPATPIELNITMLFDQEALARHMNGMGTLRLDGAGTLNVGSLKMLNDFKRVEMEYKFGGYQDYDPWGTDPERSPYEKYGFTSIIANTPWTAGHVEQAVNLPNYQWMFVCPLFDVKVSDILVTDELGGQFVVRQYDSGQRAAAHTADTWHQLSADDTMLAGHGYIVQGVGYYQTHNDISSKGASLLLPSKTGGSMGTLCATTDITVTLSDYPSEFAHNRGWNLVGNPYPCYVDGSQVDFTAPITIWNPYRKRYDAIRLTDDAYVFSPMEAFFVQYSPEASEMVFHSEGRQLSLASRKDPLLSPRRAAQTNRKVFNVSFSGGGDADHTRFVINPDARTDYEADKDAVYTPSLSENVSAIYTCQNGIRYAINERPEGEGVIVLGLHVAKEGTYTIAINADESDKVTLIDRQEGTTVPLTTEGYTFITKAGTIEGRFYLQLGNTTDISGELTIENGESTTAPMYNLNGQRVTTATKGIYIIGGKKHVVK
jgi:hypothetical protein